MRRNAGAKCSEVPETEMKEILADLGKDAAYNLGTAEIKDVPKMVNAIYSLVMVELLLLQYSGQIFIMQYLRMAAKPLPILQFLWEILVFRNHTRHLLQDLRL